jgi:hypothetical protein
MTGGPWKITVESWLTPEAKWYGRREYILSGENIHSLPAALEAMAKAEPQIYLHEGYYSSGIGPAPEPNVDFSRCPHCHRPLPHNEAEVEFCKRYEP